MKTEKRKLKTGKNGQQGTSLFVPFTFPFSQYKSSGFILLFASLIASVLLTIGLGIGSIVLKEIILSSIGKESQIAFFAADTGTECALYWNEKANIFNTAVPNGTPRSCAGSILLSGGVNPADPTGPVEIIGGATISVFGLAALSPDNDSCAIVTVEKDASLGTTLIESSGYNTCEEDARRVERKLRVQLAPQPSPPGP